MSVSRAFSLQIPKTQMETLTRFDKVIIGDYYRGQLMLADSTICGPDDPVAIFLSGVHEGFTDGTWKLMHGEWKDLTYADCVEVSLENYFLLNERRFLEVGGG